MDSTQFAYWLQGFLELSEAKVLDERQLECIREHLNLVFAKVTGQNPLPDKAAVDYLTKEFIRGAAGTRKYC